MKYLKLLLILLFILSIPSYAGTIDPSTPDSSYVEYGAKFHYVVSICGSYKDDTLFCASAVLIDDHHLLTAAHVVKNCKTCYVSVKDKKYVVSSVVVNKDFDQEFGCGDIAIGYCEDSFNLDFYPNLYDSDDEIGKVCCISGYGLTGTFNSGAINHDGKKRAGSNMIERSFKDVIVCDPSKRHDKDYTSLEFCIASGDSGGGLFIGNKLAGINSFIMAEGRSPKSTYGEESCHTRISKFIGWINENKTKMDKSPTRK